MFEKKCHNSNDFLSILDKKNCSRILSTRSVVLDTNQSVLIGKMSNKKKKFFKKGPFFVQKGSRILDFFFNKKKAPAATPPAEKNCLWPIK